MGLGKSSSRLAMLRITSSKSSDQIARRLLKPSITQRLHANNEVDWLILPFPYPRPRRLVCADGSERGVGIQHACLRLFPGDYIHGKR